MLTVALCYAWYALVMGCISTLAGSERLERVMGALCVVGNFAILQALGAFK